MYRKIRGYIIFAVKVTVSAGLLYFLLTRINLESFIAAGQDFPMWSLAPLTVLFVGTVFFGSWRWQIFLSAHGVRQSILKGVKLYLVGYFFNNFLPSGVGGDVVRGYSAGKDAGRMSEVYASIAAERLTGLLGTMLIALIFLPIVRPPSPLSAIILLLNAALWAGTILFIFLNFENFLRKLLGKLPFGVGHKIADFVEAVRHFRKDRVVLLKGLLLSVIYQGSLISFVWVVAQVAVVKEIPWSAYFVFVPLVWVISLIPISLNALGVREASFSYFFGMWGAPEAKGLLVSLVFFGTSVIAGAVGGIIWAISGHRAKMTDIPDGDAME